MRFAIAATDRYIGVAHAFVKAGWQPVKLFTTPVDDRLHRNKSVIEWAGKLKIPTQISRLNKTDLQHLKEAGCDALVVASYSWRIPDWRAYLGYAINFHPSPLPDGRGPDPTVRALLEGRRSWAVTCHVIEHAFDSGAILGQEHFELAEDECRDAFDLKIQLAGLRLTARVAQNFAALWDGALPQGEGSYWPSWNLADRTLKFSGNVSDVLRQVRAFGPIECVAVVNKITLFVKRAVGWQEPHTHALGSVVYENSLCFVVAVADGFVGIVEWSLFAPGATTGKGNR
jgi:methionyl-tRNA formyltransferase